MQKWNSIIGAACLAAVTAVPASAAPKTVLHVGLAIREIVPFFQSKLKPMFEAQNPDVDVEFEYISWSADKYVAAYAAGDPPDVAQIGNGIGPYLSMAMPLDGFVKTWPDLSDFPKPVLGGFTVGGHLYALPWTYGTRIFQYRKDWFADSGLDPNKPPTNWDELAQMGQKLARYDSAGDLTRQGIATSSNYIDFSTFLFQSGGTWMSRDLKHATYADANGMKSVRFVQRLFNELHISDPGRKLKGLSDGGAAMEYDQPLIAPGASSAFKSTDIGVAQAAADIKTQIILPEGLIISNKTAHPDVAWRWVQFVLSTEAVLTKGRALYALGGVPPRLSMATYSPWKDDPRWQTIFASLATAKTPPQASPFFDQMRQLFAQPALDKTLYQDASPAIWQESMTKADTWLSEQLQ